MSCIVCGAADASHMQAEDSVRFECRRCGVFVLAGSAEAELPAKLKESPLRSSLMSHTLRRMQRPDESNLHKITTYDLPTFWRNERLPTPKQQADNLILWVGDNQQEALSFASIYRAELAAWIGLPITHPNDSIGWVWLHSQLKDEQLYEANIHDGRFLDLRLTMKGWERYQQLKKSEIESRTAFMAMKFGQSDLDQVVNECFRPAVKRTGFELRLLTDKQQAGVIDNQLRAALLASRFVISDLTHGSPGAYWEAGFGEGLGRPVFYTCEKTAWSKQRTHFDTNHLFTIIWDIKELRKAENDLVATIRATLRAEAKQSDEA